MQRWRSIAGKRNIDRSINRITRTEGIRHSRQNHMRCFTPEIVHQRTRPRLFTPKVKRAVQVKDADGFHSFRALTIASEKVVNFPIFPVRVTKFTQKRGAGVTLVTLSVAATAMIFAAKRAAQDGHIRPAVD